MKRKIALIVLLSMLFGGIVSAAGLYGTFEGYRIVRVQLNGQSIAVEDVPAVNLNGRTMVPIYMLRDLGMDVQWNGETETVNVTTPVATRTNTGFDAESLYSLIGKQNVNMIEYASDGDGFSQIAYEFTFRIPDEQYDSVYSNAVLTGLDYNVTQVRVEDSTGFAFFIKMDKLRDYLSGKINEEQFISSIEYVNQTSNYNYPTQPIYVPPSHDIKNTPSVIKSKIVDEFEGFEEGNIYELDNGQVWKQVDYKYKYKYKYRPKVLIYKDGYKYYMTVEGMDDEIEVEPLN